MNELVRPRRNRATIAIVLAAFALVAGVALTVWAARMDVRSPSALKGSEAAIIPKPV